MIAYKIDIMEALKNIGYSSYKLRQDKIFGEATMTKFRKKKHFNFDNLNILCNLLQCQPGDILEYVPDSGGGEEKEIVPKEETAPKKTTPVKIKLKKKNKRPDNEENNL